MMSNELQKFLKQLVEHEVRVRVEFNHGRAWLGYIVEVHVDHFLMKINKDDQTPSRVVFPNNITMIDLLTNKEDLERIQLDL